MLMRNLTAELLPRQRIDHPPQVSTKSLTILQNYHWPGNVRELRNRLERSLILSGGKTISVPLMFDRTDRERWAFNLEFQEGSSLNHFKKEALRYLITEALVRAGGKRQAAAKLLGISRYSLKRHMTNLGFIGNGNE